MSRKNTQYIQPHIARKYQIIQKVGSGAYGHVWKVQDKKTKEVYALKKIFDAFQHATDAQRTYREVTVLQQLHHPNIVRLIETIRAQNNRDLYMVLQFMEADLYQVISEDILKEVHRKFIVYQIAKALKYLHSGSLIHRDLKPSNILINSQCFVKLCDFGLVRSLGFNQQSQPILTEGVATRWYRAPQVLLGSKHYSTPADVWSFGCVIYQLITGKSLFPGNSTIDQLEKILEFTGIPSHEDVMSLDSQIGRAMVLSAKPKMDKYRSVFQGIDQLFKDLLSKILVFNPSKRITINQVLEHQLVRAFKKIHEQIICEGPIKPLIDDNRKQSVQKYRSIVYGSKRYSLTRTNAPNNNINTLKKTNSYKTIKQIDPNDIMKYIKTTDNFLKKQQPYILKQSVQGSQKIIKTSLQEIRNSKFTQNLVNTANKNLKKTSIKPGTSMVSSLKPKETMLASTFNYRSKASCQKLI